MFTQKDLSFSLKLNPESEQCELTVHCKNVGRKEATIAQLERYFLVELKNQQKRFTSGQAHNVSVQLPSKNDYVTIKPGETTKALFKVLIQRKDERDDPLERDYVLAGHLFEKVPQSNELRVSYRPERMMPNLPSSKKKSFASDVIVGGTIALKLP